MAPLAVFPRDEFLEEKFDYRPGESAVLVGPTGSGKSHLAWSLMDVAGKQNPQLHMSALQPKPADETTSKYAAQLGMQRKGEYPFKRKFWEDKPRGYVHWPNHIKGDADADNAHLSAAFKKSLSGEYWEGSSLVLVDDTYLIGAVYHCNRELDQFLIAGRSNKAGLIGCLQAPKGTVSSGGVSSFFYSQPTHMFFFRDNTEANRDKLGQISMGLDPRMIEEQVKNLQVYRINDSAVSEVLYLDRRGPYAAIIRPW